MTVRETATAVDAPVDAPVDALVDALGAAFLSGDPDRVLGHFASTGHIVYAGSEPGEVAVGRVALQALLAELFGRDERYSWRTTSVSAAGTATTLYVVADADLLIHPEPPGAPVFPATETIPYRVSGVLEREAAGWRWRLCQGSEPAQPAATS
jgi:hypothetical protein